MEPRLRFALARAEELAAEMSNPDLARDPAKIKALGREHARLEPVVRLHDRLQRLRDELGQAIEMSDDSDAEFAEMARGDVTRLRPEVEQLEQALHDALMPRDPLDDRDAILEIRAGTGGDEAGLFAGELVRLYTRFAERHGLTVESISLSDGNMGGVKEAVFAVRGPDAYGLLRRESGVHRVQRVPATETQGRIHTSAATVAVLPEAEEIDVRIDPQDLKIDVFRSSGPGGQSVNTTDSAVRITHLPSGIVVSQQDQKSQLQNREAAMRVLRARLLARQQEELAAAASDARKTQIRSMDRSERIRTYNFPENRIADHRTGYKAYNLDQVMNGALDPIIESAVQADEEAQLSGLGDD